MISWAGRYHNQDAAPTSNTTLRRARWPADKAGMRLTMKTLDALGYKPNSDPLSSISPLHHLHPASKKAYGLLFTTTRHHRFDLARKSMPLGLYRFTLAVSGDHDSR